MERNKKKLLFRVASNVQIPRERAQITKFTMVSFFQNAKGLRHIQPGNLINYDETNLTENPDTEKFIFNRECKCYEYVVDN